MPKPPDATHLWQFARAKIEHEDKWIQQRVSWNLAANSFLLAAYALAIPSSGPVGLTLSRVIVATIPIFGLLSSSLVLVGLAAAWVAQDKALDEWRSLVPDSADRARFPELHSKGPALVLGKIASWGITLVALGIWISVLALSCSALLPQAGVHWR